MQRLQLYIKDNEGNYPLVDFFDKEIVELTSTIKDVRDIEKIFTDYSQTFVVPASETNNKIFRHYYNYYITGNSYDSRKKKEALLHINYAPFRKGKIFLNSVKMRNNKPYAYELVFYGHTVSLKDLIGDDELTHLAERKNQVTGVLEKKYLSNYDHEYNEVNVKSGLTDGIDFLIDGEVQQDAIIYPLITSEKRLYFHSGTPEFNSDGNVYHDESLNPDGDPDRGLKFTDLKPAIRGIHIIEAIENTYGIEFTRDFFDSPAFSNLFLWINSKRGEFNDLDDDEQYLFTYFVDGFTEKYPSAPYSESLTIDGSELTVDTLDSRRYKFRLDIVVSDQNVEYDVILRNKTTGAEFKQSYVGDDTFETPYDAYTSFIEFNLAEWEKNPQYDSNGSKVFAQTFDIEIRSKEALTISPSNFVYYHTDIYNFLNDDFYNTNTGQFTEAQLLMKDRLPKMKVMDFLTGLFKMFNLVAYYIDEEGNPRLTTNRQFDDDRPLIYIDTLDNFYSDSINNKLGGLIDLDKYLDTTSHTVNSTLPFTDIKFNYEKTDTVLMENHLEQFNEVFGDAEFNVKRNFPNIDRGKKYEIKLPFSHMKYERLLDLNVDSTSPTKDTLIQWGYCAGGDFNPDADAVPAPTGNYDTLLIKPLLFYGIKITDLPEASVANGNRSGKINWISTSPPTGLTSYWRPSNSNDAGNTTTPPTYNLNFDQEFDEWQTMNYGDYSNSLYNVFYKNYIESVFNPARRMFKVTAYLPANILINYKLNDQIKIQDKIFRINSITTNLMTGKSELELLNIFQDQIVE
jgi:hypothetical protein